jgi:hypothetical protein
MAVRKAKTVDLVQTALLFSGVGAGVAKITEMVITRINAKDTNTITLTTHMSDQSKLLFDQLTGTIKDQNGTIKDVTADRNNLQLRVFELIPDATKMVEFEKELASRGLTFEDCLIMVREATGDNVHMPGRRWYERKAPQVVPAPTQDTDPLASPQPGTGPG